MGASACLFGVVFCRFVRVMVVKGGGGFVSMRLRLYACRDREK